MDKGETWRLNEQCSVDLHRRLHTAGRRLPDEWWERFDTFTVAGHNFRALDRCGRMAHAASHYALSYPNHRILSSLADLLLIVRGSGKPERQLASSLLASLGVADLVLRITSRASWLCDDERVVLGSAGNRPLDLALKWAYDRPDLDKVALKLAKTFGMPPRDQWQVLKNWIAPSDTFLLTGGYTSRSDRITAIVRRRLDRSQLTAESQETIK